jgi:hypothetical protein
MFKKKEWFFLLEQILDYGARASMIATLCAF